MSEFSNRVDAQRQILRIVNETPWKSEQLFALNTKAIQRWVSANHIEISTRLVDLLRAASAEIFVMANHSDEPIAGTYVITKRRVETLKYLIKLELSDEQFGERRSESIRFEKPPI